MNENRNHAPMNPERDHQRSRTREDRWIPNAPRKRLWAYALTMAEAEYRCFQPGEWKEAERC